jgi:arabinan endo-1,5-alpha-L-arabinosidase
MPFYTNPVFDTDFPDPMILRAPDGCYYAYATQTIVAGRTLNIQVARSPDLIHWERLGDALPVKPGWARHTQGFWGPHVLAADDRYYLYYSASPDEGEGLCLAVAVATAPGGPFVDSGAPLRCGPGFANIDPMAFDDPATGQRLLYWGSGFGPIYVQPLAPDRVHFAPGTEPLPLLYPHGTRGYERLIEAAYVVARDGYYYLFSSGDNCCGDHAHYAVLVARSEHATGPFEPRAGAAGTPDSVILQRSARWDAPGHNGVIRDAAGDDWIVYHAIDPQRRCLDASISGDRDVRRILLIDRLVYQDGWPMVAGGIPSADSRPAPQTG